VPSRGGALAAKSIPHPVPARSEQRESRRGRARRPAHATDASRSLEMGPAPRRSSSLSATARHGAAGGAAATAPERAPVEGSRGPDFGLVLACLGLLGAAALLGLSEDGRAATRRTRQRAATLLSPLMGRR
jgi:hypothetical protein